MNQNPRAKSRLLSCGLLVRKASEAPQIIKANTVAVGGLSELNSKILLLKTPHVCALTAGHGQIKLGNELETNTLMAAFYIVREGLVGCWWRALTILLAHGP